MNTSETADEFVKVCIDGMDRILRISGVGAKNIAMMLIAMSKEKQQTKGKTRLTNMLKTRKAFKNFYDKSRRFEKVFARGKKIWRFILCFGK